MGRPRQFDEGQAVEAACHVFWAKGYEATSTEDLCKATGLGRSSIYNTFKSKKDLFLLALSYYVDTMTTRQVSLLAEEGRPAAERIRRLFSVIIESEMENRREGCGSGCFTVNTTTALAASDPQVAEVLNRDLERRLVSLRAVIAEGGRDGSVTSPQPVEGLAWYLTALIAGVRVAAQSGADRSALDQIAASGMDALNC